MKNADKTNLEHILGIPQEEQVKGEAISYSQDEEKVLKAVDKEDYQAARNYWKVLKNRLKKEWLPSSWP